MIKKILYGFCAGAALTAVFACSEDDLSVNSKLDETVFDKTTAEAGTADAMINDFYDRYGSKIMYKFETYEFDFAWNSANKYWYAPTAAGSDEHIKTMITFLEDGVLAKYPDIFVRKYLPSRIFLVDSLCSSSAYSDYDIADALATNAHSMAISHVGASTPYLTDEDWPYIETAIDEIIMASVYNDKTEAILAAFFDLKFTRFSVSGQTDPMGEFTDWEYTLYSNNCAGAVDYGYYNEDGSMDDPTYAPIYKMSNAQYLGYYLSFIMTSPKTKMDKVFARFPTMKSAVNMVAGYMVSAMEMDPVAMQNQSCPADPVPADYFN